MPFVGSVEDARVVDLRALAAGRIEALEVADGGRAPAGGVVFRLGGERLEAALAAAREVRAPFPGRLVERGVSVGQEVAAGDLLARLADEASVRIAATVIGEPGRQIEAGREARVRLAGGREREVTVAGVTATATVSGAERVWLTGESLSGLLPGTAVSGWIVVDSHVGLVVPARSVARDEDDRPYLFVGRSAPFERREVVLGVELGERELAAEEMDLLVARPLEEALRGAPGLERVSSSSQQGVSVVTAQFTWGTGVESARTAAVNAVAQATPRLPAGAAPRIEQIGTTLQEVGVWAVASPGDPLELSRVLLSVVAPRLTGMEGVALVEVVGGERPALWVDVPPQRLVALGLGVDDLVTAIRRAHGAEPVGFVERSNEDVVVRADSRLRGAADLAAVPVPLPDGGRVRLDAIATVHAGWAPRHSEVRLDDRPAVALRVRKQPGASTVDVVEAVRDELERLAPALPAGSTVRQVYDQAEILLAAESAILHEMLLGGALAVLVLWLLLGELRPTVAVAITIPLALLATVAALWLSGETLNAITLAALTLAVGIVVDDAIVVAESVFRHLERGAVPAVAALEGTLEIAGPDASGTFTTVASFAPLLLLSGLAAVFLRPFGWTVSSALLASLVLSLTIVPVVLSLGRRPGPSRPRLGARRVAAAGDRLVRALRHTLRHRGVTLALAAGVSLALGAGLAMRHGAVSLLPPVDEGALLVEYVLPPGVSLVESQRVASRITGMAAALPGVVAVASRVGSPAGGSEVEGVDRGELLVKLAPLERRHETAEEILAELDAASAGLEGVVLLLHQPTQEKMDESVSGLPALFGVSVYGEDPVAIEVAAGRVAEMLRADAAVSGVIDDSRFHRPELVVRLDGERCAALGVDPAAARTTLAAAVWGFDVLEVVRDRQTERVRVRLAGGPRSLDALGEVLVPAGDGSAVPLSAVARLQFQRVASTITRIDGRRQLTVLAELEGDLAGQARRIRGRLDQLPLPRGVDAAVTGRFPVLLETGRDLLLVYAGAAALILAILALQLGSLRQAAWILAVVPAGLAGAAAGLALTTTSLDLAVAAGLLTLLGIGVNNGILLVDFANRERARGAEPEAAMLEAVRVRLRPVIATSLTTMAALAPTALGVGAGEHLFQPFAVTVICGLAVGTVVTLLVLPAAVLPSLARRPRGAAVVSAS